MDLNAIPVPPAMTVEIDVYSGRLNPEWTLGSRDAAEVLRLLAQETAIDIAPHSLEPLGFRGFVIRIETPIGTRRVYVHDGLSRSGECFYRDAGRELEKSILSMMPEHLKHDLKDVLPE